MNSGNRRKAQAGAVAGAVNRLLAHYPTANVQPSVRAAEMQDWIDDLLEFGPELVETACAEYRRSDIRERPKPGEIRFRCIRLQSERSEVVESAEARRERSEAQAERRRHRDDELAREGRDICTRWAQERGFATLDDYAAAKGIRYTAAAVEVCRSILSNSPIPPVLGFKTGGTGMLANEIVGGGFTVTDPKKSDVR